MKLEVDSPAYVVGFAAAVSAAFTAAVMSVQVATAAKIRRNEALREERALVQVFGLAEAAKLAPEAVAALVEQRVGRAETVRDPATGRAFRFFRASAPDGSPLAVAFEFRGSGFWAPITGLAALTPDLATLVGLVVVDQAETPGLGGRITEEAFQEQFRGLRLGPPAEGRPAVYIQREKPTSRDDPRFGRTVEAITGATQTSLALERLLNADLEEFRRAMAREASGAPRAGLLRWHGQAKLASGTPRGRRPSLAGRGRPAYNGTRGTTALVGGVSPPREKNGPFHAPSLCSTIVASHPTWDDEE